MRLAKLSLKNYRSCYGVDIIFADHLTLVLGENDAGKSNVVDALRTTLPPASGRQTSFFDRDRDQSYGCTSSEEIEVTRVYSDLTPGEDGLFTAALVDNHRDLIHTTVYKPDLSIPRRQRVSHSIGSMRVPDPEPELRDRISHVYLPPLRNAARALDSADGNRLADIIQTIATEEEIGSFEIEANRSLAALAEDPVSRKVIHNVQDHLSSLTRPVRHRTVGIKHHNQRLRRLARALRIHMAAEGLTPSDLLGSGLGYANLLYIATVVLELERAAEFDLTILLVEEPEAHLHPQLQSVLLSYLYERAVESAQIRDGTEPAGRIQVIATTHSPQLASAVSTKNIVVLRSTDRKPGSDRITETANLAHPVEDPWDAPPITPLEPEPCHAQTVASCLAEIDMTPAARRKVDRYLDATRSNLLFARQVILVEGIAEALLLRTLAERVLFPRLLDNDPVSGTVNQSKREQFRAISIVAIDGVDFLPYLEILLSRVPIADRVAVITDGDGGQGDARKIAIETRYRSYIDSGLLSVHVGDTTLEAELYAPSVNEGLLRQAFSVQHPRSVQKWDAIRDKDASREKRALAFSTALKDKTLDLGKGDFAHVIAELLQDDEAAQTFQVPEYLREALDAVLLPLPPAFEKEEPRAPAVLVS